MSINTVTHKVEFRFTPGSGSWTDMSGYIDAESGLGWERGIGTDRKMRASGLTFSMDNSSEDLTIGNASSTYFNKIRKGIEVRYSWTYSGTTKTEFQGYVTTIRPVFAQYGRARNRVAFQCEGQTSFLRKYTKYGMALQASLDVDDALTAIMTACGQASALYSFADSSLVIPHLFPRGDALTDLVAAAQSDPGMLLFEDGQGRLRLKAVVGGNHGSPDHTWGGSSNPQPEGDISPDYQSDSQYARASVTVGAFRPTYEDVVLYRHKLNWETGFVESLSGYSKRRIEGEFDVMPASVVTKFSQTIVPFIPTADTLYATIDAVSTTLYTWSASITPKTFKAGDQLLIDQEIMTITATAIGAYYQQKLTVVRGQSGSIAAPHYNNSVPVRLYRRGDSYTYSLVDPTASNATLATGVTATKTTGWAMYNGGTTNLIGQYLIVDSEIVKVTAWTTAFNFSVTRGEFGTEAAAHVGPAGVVQSGAPVWKVTVNPVAEMLLGKSYILGSEFPAGIPIASPDIVGNPSFTNGDHIQVTGNKFIAEIYNNASGARYLSDLVIGGKAMNENAKSATFVMEKAIPSVFGIPEASAAQMPYGAASIYPAKGYVLGLLRSGRVPTPWLTLPFTVNDSVKTASMLTAEIGDLVRYTGTGSYTEKVDEWYRIVGLKGELLPNDLLRITATLAPSHLWRNPQQGWYTNFNWGVAQGVLSLGEFDVSPPGLWNNVTNWTRVLKSGRYEATMAVANPSPAAVDVGNADQTVFAHVAFNSTPCTFPSGSGGVGVMFRGNASTPTAYWEARFNPTTNQVILWNTTDAGVATATWLGGTGSAPEIEVRAQGNRIRVFVDCAPEPVIDFTSTRFQTQTYAGPTAEVTSLAGSPVQPTFRDWGAHGL